MIKLSHLLSLSAAAISIAPKLAAAQEDIIIITTLLNCVDLTSGALNNDCQCADVVAFCSTGATQFSDFVPGLEKLCEGVVSCCGEDGLTDTVDYNACWEESGVAFSDLSAYLSGVGIIGGGGQLGTMPGMGDGCMDQIMQGSGSSCCAEDSEDPSCALMACVDPSTGGFDESCDCSMMADLYTDPSSSMSMPMMGMMGMMGDVFESCCTSETTLMEAIECIGDPTQPTQLGSASSSPKCWYYDPLSGQGYSVRDDLYDVCVSFCWDCAMSSDNDILCTNEQKTDGTKVSMNMGLPLDSLEVYATTYADFGFTSCETDDCNKADACTGAIAVPVGQDGCVELINQGIMGTGEIPDVNSCCAANPDAPLLHVPHQGIMGTGEIPDVNSCCAANPDAPYCMYHNCLDMVTGEIDESCDCSVMVTFYTDASSPMYISSPMHMSMMGDILGSCCTPGETTFKDAAECYEFETSDMSYPPTETPVDGENPQDTTSAPTISSTKDPLDDAKDAAECFDFETSDMSYPPTETPVDGETPQDTTSAPTISSTKDPLDDGDGVPSVPPTTSPTKAPVAATVPEAKTGAPTTSSTDAPDNGAAAVGATIAAVVAASVMIFI
eukprot:CAMPEP_0202029174 /NCGR_PEP_ID=MMETSP0905-20130828/63834_1 /ASSEMBLY_ACC=CAM_ASM_000554 /TAXON_ID=420261 /ORGANISM="Thalassiosira antarctica, Strain CCMP982" /LENGTH=610 /DNA_ID=CAMNT_0048592917 /DNA_START=746 /DNA_END=2578 /DNA_ORIENTATION=-